MDNVVGPEIIMQARTSSESWNRTAERWLRNWMSAIDPAQRTSFTEAAQMTVTARLYNGEVFHQPTKDGYINLIEAERIRAPQSGQEYPAGYRVDQATGRVVAWLVHTRDRNGQFGLPHAETWVPDLIHCARRWRPDQVRGWPDLASVANIATDIGEINSANLRKYKMGAITAWTFEKGQSGAKLQGRTATPETAGSQPLAKFKEGQIYEIESGAELKPFVNNQPGSEYAPFVELNLRLVGMALRIPYEFLLCYFGGSNFASSKTALLQTYRTVLSWQSWTARRFILPVVSWRVAKAIAERELPPAPVDADGVSEWARWEWQLPSTDWIDPQNMVQSEMQEVRIGAISMWDVCARRGRDAEDVARLNARYLKMLARVAAENGVDPAALHNIQIPGQTPTAAPSAAPGAKDGSDE